MNRHLRIGLAVLAAAVIASGCVSKGTFKKMEAQKNDEIMALQQQKAGLEKERIEICHLTTNSGVKFAETLCQKSEQLKKLGPNPGKTGSSAES